MGMTLTKEFVNRCRNIGALRDFLCQAMDQVDEKDKEIAELKESLKESEEARYEAGSDAADYYQENRRLRRALYKACANWAHFAVAFFSSYAIKEKWRKMENKCQSKAEEYK